jgi:hypothetical protein
MNYSPHAEFAALYKNYTSAPDSIAKHLTRRMVQLTESDPLQGRMLCCFQVPDGSLSWRAFVIRREDLSN